MANHPHDSSRPESPAVKRALANDDIPALKKALTVRQRAFAHEYIVDFIGKAAAVRAGYSPTHADRQAYLLLHNAGVARYIDHLQHSKASQLTIVNPDYVIAGITAILSKEDARDADKLRGFELLAKHLGMFIDRTEITGRDGEAIEINNRRVEEEARDFTNLLDGLRKKADKIDVELLPDSSPK